MYITWDWIITAGAVLAAVLAIGTVLLKIIRWVDQQKKQDKEIADLKAEQQIVIEGILACLKGLSEQGCNGPVRVAITKIEDHLNKKAHK